MTPMRSNEIQEINLTELKPALDVPRSTLESRIYTDY